MNSRITWVGVVSLLSACTPEASLDKAVAEGDVAKMQYLCEGKHLGIQKEVPRDTQEKACKAQSAYERAQIPKMSCEDASASFAKGAKNRSNETRDAYYLRFVECGQWMTFWTGNGDQTFIELLQREAKTPEGETGLRASITQANRYELHSIVGHLRAIDDAGGPDVTAEVSAAYDRAEPEDAVTIYKYLVSHKHPKSITLTTDNLASAKPKTRALGCWGAGELSAAQFRPAVERLATTDSYSESLVEQGRFIAQHFVVRDECHQALAKISSIQ